MSNQRPTTIGESCEPQFSLVDFIVDYESGVLSFEETVAGFQKLIDNGLVWSLQGCYGRQAAQFIKDGLCHLN